VADILALARVPERVVLSACDAARMPDDSPAEGLGVAHAFLVAGAGAVVATSRPAGDKLAGRIMAGLYREWPGGGEVSLADALRRAELAARRETPEEDWASFRLLVP
jgi:CHAT domain-containing protein